MSSDRAGLGAFVADPVGDWCVCCCGERGDLMVTSGGLTLLYVVVGLVAVGFWYFRAVRNGR